MKRSHATLTAWLLVILTATAIFYETTINASPIIVFVSILTGIGLLVLAIWESVTWGEGDSGPYANILYKKKDSYRNEENSDYQHTNTFNFNFKKVFKWGLIIGGIILLYNLITPPIKGSISVFNASKSYQNYYNLKVQEKRGFYDKMWKTYLTKEKITNINKETFLTVSKVIMENRADGKNLTWKWVQENQKIPYEEFTKFYSDLSNFITEQREGYFRIEQECQEIARYNNTMIDTFPNNIYNKFLDCPRINFEYGILSDSTNNVFKSGVENLR